MGKTHGVLLLSSRQKLWIFLDANKMASWDFSPMATTPIWGDYIEFNLKSGHLKCFNGTNHLQSAYSSGMVFCSILKPIPKQFNYRQVLWCGISLAQDHVWTRNTAAVTLQSGRIRSRHSRYAAMPNGQAMNCILGKPFWTARSCHAPALRCRPWLKSVKPKRADVCCLKGAEMPKMFQKMFQHQFLKIIQIL